MYAIVKTGGKQYRVSEGSMLVVEKIEGEIDTDVNLQEVMMLQGDNGLLIGAPLVDGAHVEAKIVEQVKGPKINSITFKPKKNIRRRYGHRQPLTKLQITAIVAPESA